MKTLLKFLPGILILLAVPVLAQAPVSPSPICYSLAVPGCSSIDTAPQGAAKINLNETSDYTTLNYIYNLMTTGGIAAGTVPASGVTGGPLSIAQGGTGTVTPGDTAGANITITGTWPNETFSANTVGSVASLAPPANIILTGAPSVLNSFLYWPGTLSGIGAFATGGGVPARYAPMFLDYANTAYFPNNGVGSTGLADFMFVYDHLETGWNGFQGGLDFLIQANAPPASICFAAGVAVPCNTSGALPRQTNINGFRPFVKVNANFGGIPGSYLGSSGNIFSSNISTTLTSAATYFTILNGGEFDINNQAIGGWLAEKHGLDLSLVGFCGSFFGCSSEEIAKYNDTMLDATTGDDYGTSVWDTILNCTAYSHAGACDFATTYIGAHRRYAGGQAESTTGGYTSWGYNTPRFKEGLGLNNAQFPQASTATGISLATMNNPYGSMVQVTYAASSYSPSPAVYNTPPPGSIISITGATPASLNDNFLVLQSQTVAGTTTLGFTSAVPVTCSSACGTAIITTPQGYSVVSPDAAIDSVGGVHGSSLNVSGSLTAQSAPITSITASNDPFGGYVGGAYFPADTAGHPTFTFATPNGETAPTVGTITYRLNAALLMTDTSSGIGSVAETTAKPNGAGVVTNCSASETLTITGTGGATILVTTAFGVPTSATITNRGLTTTWPSAPFSYTSTGSCTTALTGWLQLGFGIVSAVVSGGSNYPCLPSPSVYTNGFKATINTHGHFTTNTTANCVTTPLTVASPIAPPQYTIVGLPSCTATPPPTGYAGTWAAVSNGVASPTYNAVPSTTGTTIDPVFCNGSNWTYH